MLAAAQNGQSNNLQSGDKSMYQGVDIWARISVQIASIWAAQNILQIVTKWLC